MAVNKDWIILIIAERNVYQTNINLSSLYFVKLMIFFHDHLKSKMEDFKKEIKD